MIFTETPYVKIVKKAFPTIVTKSRVTIFL